MCSFVECTCYLLSWSRSANIVHSLEFAKTAVKGCEVFWSI